ncbi:MAG: LamB/YcsF family protein [Panacagrimonas sp.]
MRVDLNADVGEGAAGGALGQDPALMQSITSANVACGFHAGDPNTMHRFVMLAREVGCSIGAHPGFNDLWGFGRRQIKGDSMADIEKMFAYQIGALQGCAAMAGHRVHHVKAHGAIANMAAVDRELALAMARAVKAVDRALIYVALPGTELERTADEVGLTVAREYYADRTYDDTGNLTPRKQQGAVIHDAEEAATRVLRMVEEGGVRSTSDKLVPVAIDTICVHGDNPAAVAMARTVRQRLEAAGIAIRPMAETLA